MKRGLVLLIAMAVASCSVPAGTISQTGTFTGPAAAPSALDRCEAAVDVLLIKDLDAIEQGYSGIDINQVAAQYGVSSAVFKTYSQLQAQLAEDAFQYGAANALQPVYRRVVATCQEYGVQPAATASSPSPQSSAPAVPASGNTAGCPGPAQLLAAWNAAPLAARRSWTSLSPSGMSDVTCWRTWAVTSPVMQANGLVVFPARY